MTSPVIDAGDDLPLTLPSLWRSHVRTHDDRNLLVCDDTRLSYARAEARSRLLARGLLAAGVSKSSHIALLFPSGADFIVGALAAARIGAVIMPLSTLSTADELRTLLTNSDATFLLAAPEFRSRRYTELLETALPELDLSRPPPSRFSTAPWLRRIWLTGPVVAGRDRGWSFDDLERLAATVDDAYLDAIEARVSPADRFVIIHTSGSTTQAKGVIHTHGALIRHLDNINQIRGYTRDDVLFSTSPWFWVAGFAFGLLGTLVAGACIVCSNATEAADILDVIERERPTMANGYAPAVMRLAADPTFSRRDFSSMRRGNLHPIMPPAVRARDPDLRHNIYGMSEAGGALTMSGDECDLPEQMRGSCGSFLPGYEAKIVDPETRTELARGEVGELWIRSPLMMEGYYGRPRSDVFEPDGWWRTGDLGVIDGGGFFYFKARRGSIIKTAGANVAPAEVESVLRELTGSPQCVVLGLPDAQRGQVVAAVIVGPSDIDLEKLQQRLASKLSSYKVPRRVLRISQSDLPLLSSGKVDMRKLAALFRDDNSGGR